MLGTAGTFYLLSYPRSGSTLTRSYFAALQGRPQLSQYERDVVVPPDPEARPLTSALAGLRLVKSHHFSPLHRPAVYLVRDGRNAMLSNLFLKFLSGGHQLQRPEQVCAGLRMLTSEDEFWGDHVAQALQLASREEVCFVRYEDLIADPLGALHTIATFMGATVPSHSLREAVSAVQRSDGYRLRMGSGYTYSAEPGSLYEPVQRDRGGDYWRKLFDADARRYFHVRGGTPGLLHFGYENHEDWWRATAD